MPNDKRQRHKAGRDARRAALEAQRRRQQNRKRAIAAVIVIALVVGLVALVAGTGDNGTDVATDTTTTSTTIELPDPVPPVCPDLEGEDERTIAFTEPFPTCIEEGKDYRAVIEFDNGTVEVDLAEGVSPTTVNNFVALAGHRFYEDVVCHRVLRGFVVQCGDPTGTGRGGPGYTIAEEPPESGSYEVGQLAMAKAGAPNSTGSQFFIITGARGAALPPDYSFLGTITSGLEVAKEIEADGADADPAPPETMHKILRIEIEER